MLSPRLTNCPECANIPSLLRKIDCKLAELGNNLYNNISYMLNKPVPADDITQLIGYRRILLYKLCNPSYLQEYTIPMISSRVIRLTVGCVSRCNEPEPCIEEPCNITIIPNTTSTTSTSSTTTSTSTTVVPTTTTTSSSSTSTSTSTSTTTSTSSSSTTTTTTTVNSCVAVTFIANSDCDDLGYATVQYTDCNGILQTVNITLFQDFTFCSLVGSPSPEYICGAGSFLLGGTCTAPTTTTTTI